MSVNMGGEGGGEGDNANGTKYHWSRYLFGLLLLDPETLQRGHDCRRLRRIFPVEEGGALPLGQEERLQVSETPAGSDKPEGGLK